MFFAPVMEPVTEAVNVKVESVRKGETVISLGEHFEVGEVKHGNKYVTILSTEGKTLFRLEPGSSVWAERETSWSRQARDEAIHVNRVNERLRQAAAEYKHNERTKAVHAKLTEAAYEGYVADSFRMADLIQAQAKDEVFGRLYTTLNSVLEKDPNRNLVEWLEEYKKQLLREFTVHFRGLSKSTSQVSNLMDDARNEVIVKLLDRDMLWML